VELTQKIACFCREVADGTLQMLAEEKGEEERFQRALAALAAGQLPTSLEADLDALDALARRHLGHGIYPQVRRLVSLPGDVVSGGAKYWSCPVDRCTGRGRVRPGQVPPTCALSGNAMVAKSLDA